MRGRGWRRSWSGADVASVTASRRRRRRARPAGGRRRLKHRNARLQGLHGRLIGRFGQLDGPRRLIAGVDLEKSGAIIAAREAIVGAADGELFFPRAHEGLTGPFATAIVIDGVDVVEARNQRAPQHGLAAAGGDVPPPLGRPALVLFVSDRDADPIAGIVTEAEIRLGRSGGPCAGGQTQRASQEHAGEGPTGAGAAPKLSFRVSLSHTVRTQTRLTVRLSVSREVSRAVNEDRPEVVHVGQRRPRSQQIAKFLKEFRRIIVI